MWQKLKSILNPIPKIGITKRNFLMISADVRKGTVIVSYKGQVKTGKFEDNTLRNMMNNVRFEKNAQEFFTALAKLIQLTIKK